MVDMNREFVTLFCRDRPTVSGSSRRVLFKDEIKIITELPLWQGRDGQDSDYLFHPDKLIWLGLISVRMGGDNHENNSVRSMLETETQTLFANKSLLDPETIIGTDRIVGRDQQLADVVEIFKPVLTGDKVNDMMLYGPSGTGKSLIIEHVASETTELSEEYDIGFGVFTLNCNSVKTFDDVFFSLAKQVSAAVGSDVKVTKRGMSSNAKIDHMFDLFREHYDSVVVVLDEIDQLIGRDPSTPAYSDVIYQLSRTTELGLEETDVAVATISNNPTFMDDLDSRAYSSYHPTRVHFADYDSYQLAEILENRKDAFKAGVVSDEVLRLCAALAAQDYGDARQAIDLFRDAGEIANRNGESSIEPDHVYKAETMEQKNALFEQVSGMTTNKKLALGSIVLCLNYTPSSVESVPGPAAYQVYEFVSRSVGADPKSSISFNRYLNEPDTYMMVHGRKESKGKKGGVAKLYTLSSDTDTMLDVLRDDLLLDEMSDEEEEDLRNLIQSLSKSSPHIAF